MCRDKAAKKDIINTPNDTDAHSERQIQHQIHKNPVPPIIVVMEECGRSRENGTALFGGPKSKDSYRDIPVPSNMRQYAIALRQTENMFVWEAGKPNSPCNPSHFRKQFKEAIAAVKGVRVLTPHCCRHTYVSQMQALGVDLETIQSIVGHADVDMTKHYLHVQEPKRQEAVELFSKTFGTTEE